ncbi:exodeoxyribonuclease VII small subunit [Acetobacterium wieringae]|jgi:exodeoxyribonuclease VII small subunit|uniref:Exodeoxyribonuclease 7 small subunit n=1 Tax=Acetobacterium wieringae TaxID=52694 RepID=A0A1F2PIV2_9FIRM|nr:MULTISPECIES: exodeoxyribonuclease VII small subunit [Acetobacterium]MEA4805318.1 exodeoxyribonuclease VII small subunit [Acetobacterium wieringae]OFV71263.1 exodeoxyribonuclease 7 small subunit [Acetobacterium wieringae]OXS25930.1 MAG: exodeoxyribonuclease VII small subunit [Acetobacterium sp. MES1]TYC82273.1 exodeoxyribonuclease VII small subunit [Acetobacterium wieringae]URN83400.1 exodeoxyribonuclease VII small subunit [Acetobacterium wieringae]
MAVKKLKTKMNRLEAIAELLEGDELEIEASMKLFEEGMKLINECNADLDTLEGKITIMIDGEEKEFEGSLEV